MAGVSELNKMLSKTKNCKHKVCKYNKYTYLCFEIKQIC